MSNNADGYWDDDIAALDMSDVEKNGLQVYRNYTKKFAEEREQKFAAKIDENPPDISELSEVISLMLHEDIRFIPVIACAFADEELKRMLRLHNKNGGAQRVATTPFK